MHYLIVSLTCSPQDFVIFQMGLGYYAHAGDNNAAAKVPQAAAYFHHSMPFPLYALEARHRVL